MHRRLAIAVLAVSAALPAASQEAEGGEVEAVRRVFVEYKQALMTGDGDRAADLVDAATLDYFDDIKDLALTGSEEQIRARSFVDRLLIVTVRHELGAERLRTMELRDLLKHAIDSGWIARSSIAPLGIGEVVVDGDEATGEALSGAVAANPDPEAEPLYYRFVREGEAWKFRFASLVESLNRLVTEFARQMGAGEDDLIFMLVQAISGRQVLPEIWESPGGGAAEPANPASEPPQGP